MKRVFPSVFVLILILLAAPPYVGCDEYTPVTGPCNFDFPGDHGAHPGYRLEWWYYTGNVRTTSGKRYGFQLTFFRTQISPPGAEKTWPRNPSSWRTKQLYFAHAALTDIHGRRFYHAEQMARAAVGLAGVEQEGGLIKIFLRTWSAVLENREHRLLVTSDLFAFDLTCKAVKPVAMHGDRGYSLKGKKRESASCYYSYTRLKTSGFLSLNGETYSVEGTAWMDHEYSSAPLEEDLVGWDWFSLQLQDKTELMIYLLRGRDGYSSTSSAGTFVESSGDALHLNHEDFQVQVLGHWKSPHSAALYPSRWRIRIFPLDLDLSVLPNLPDQELVTDQSTQVTYWEGSVSAMGRAHEKPVDGVGYVEMTGYADPFNLTR
jgi:predicted secreted hydrolase